MNDYIVKALNKCKKLHYKRLNFKVKNSECQQII